MNVHIILTEAKGKAQGHEAYACAVAQVVSEDGARLLWQSAPYQWKEGPNPQGVAEFHARMAAEAWLKAQPELREVYRWADLPRNEFGMPVLNGHDYTHPFVDSDDAPPYPNRYIGTLRRPHPDWSGDCQGRDAEAADIFSANPPVESGFQGGRIS